MKNKLISCLIISLLLSVSVSAADVSTPDGTDNKEPELRVAEVLIPNENIIPEWEQPDSTNAYMTGDKVTYNGKTYMSTIDNNIWSPVDYPAGWSEV